jgi:hypothetical protein
MGRRSERPQPMASQGLAGKANDPGRWPGSPLAGTRGARRRPAGADARRPAPSDAHPMGAGRRRRPPRGGRAAGRGSPPEDKSTPPRCDCRCTCVLRALPLGAKRLLEATDSLSGGVLRSRPPPALTDGPVWAQDAHDQTAAGSLARVTAPKRSRHRCETSPRHAAATATAAVRPLRRTAAQDPGGLR